MKKHFIWNNNNSIEHSEVYASGAETFFHEFDNPLLDNLLNLCTYSSEEKEYTLSSEGVRLAKEQQTSEHNDFEEGEDPETHLIDVEWVIVEPEGYVKIEVDGKGAEIRWGGGKIFDLHGQEAQLIFFGDSFFIEERLSVKDRERFCVYKRLSRLRDMVEGELTMKVLRKLLEV
jgi:hypothetical protein